MHPEVASLPLPSFCPHYGQHPWLGQRLGAAFLAALAASSIFVLVLSFKSLMVLLHSFCYPDPFARFKEVPRAVIDGVGRFVQSLSMLLRALALKVADQKPDND